jgi:hypothetical protein
MQRTIEKMVWFIVGAGRGLGVGIARDEPSHIHIPRPSRVRRLEAGHGATRGARVGDEGYATAPLALNDLRPAGN